jgi:lysophospholipase-2
MATMKRRMTLPSIANRNDPIYKPAERPASDPGHQAVFIFAHGLGDSADGIEGKRRSVLLRRGETFLRDESLC